MCENTALGHMTEMPIMGISSNLLKCFIFIHLLVIEDYEQRALQKELIIVPVRLKTATSRKSY